MFKRLLVAVAGVAAYRWWSRRGERRPDHPAGREPRVEPAE